MTRKNTKSLTFYNTKSSSFMILKCVHIFFIQNHIDKLLFY